MTDEETLAKAREDHGEIAYYNVPGFGLVIVAAPENEKEYDSLVNRLQDDKQDKAVAMRSFALACVVHPDRETAKKIFKKKAAFALKVAARGQELAGGEIQEQGKD
jgi:hypothetical protein